MLIKRVEIVEFRGIRRLLKPLELGKFNVIIGRNNVGKTAILEALYLLAAPYSAYPAQPYGKSTIELLGELHGGCSSLVYGYAGEARTSYELSREVKVSDTLSTKNLEIELNEYARVEIRPLPLPSWPDILRQLDCGLDRDVLSLYIPNDTRYYRRLLEFALRDDVLRWVEKYGFHRRVAEVLSEVVYDKFTEILLRRDRLCLRKEVDGSIGPLYIDIDSLGEGVRRFVLAYLAIEYLNPRIVLWDDVEVAMHPSFLRILIKWLSSSERQVVLTTHSIDVLYALTIVRPEDCRVIVLRKTLSDEVEWKALSLNELEEFFESGIDIRKIVDELEL